MNTCRWTARKGGGASSTSDDFYFLPSVNLYRQFGSWMANISYGRSLQRPSIVMLNPFRGNVNNYFQEIGNPDLKAETNDAVTLGASLFKRQFSLSLGLTYSHTDDAILQYQKELSESGGVISSYGNIGKRNTLTGNVFVNWQPLSSLVLKLNVNGGLYDLESAGLDLSQKDYTLNIFGWADYYFPMTGARGPTSCTSSRHPSRSAR